MHHKLVINAKWHYEAKIATRNSRGKKSQNPTTRIRVHILPTIVSLAISSFTSCTTSDAADLEISQRDNSADPPESSDEKPAFSPL